MQDRLSLILHPVRLRILHAMSGGRTRTTAELCGDLPGISKATVYRHTGLLLERGLIEVVAERRVHGAVERRYRLHHQGTSVDRYEAAAMTLEDHRSGFAAALAALVADFNVYLDRGRANPVADGVSYAQAPMWLSTKEVAALSEQLLSVMRASGKNAPGRGRELYLFSPILFPLVRGDSKPQPRRGRAKR